MKITKIKDAEKIDVPGNLNVKKLYEGNGIRFVRMLFNPNESLAPHKSSNTVLLYIISGEAEVSIGDEKIKVSEKTLVECPPEIKHGIKNLSDKEHLEFLVIKFL